MRTLIMSLLCASGLFSIAVNANATKVGFGFDQGLGVTGQFNNINAFVGNDGVSADYLFAQGNFNSDIPFKWYVGAGGFYNWNDNEEFGVRVPFGVTLPFAKKWDLMAQVSPDLAHRDHQDDFEFGVGAALAIRYSF
ncbi:hypothetical protein HQQ94_16215 [Shewanella sp. VB17]|uniref:hypothetical protein n=1 Tax=Shewanella sp. VB17 TaxID=2739432 RepID=UPI0015641E8B|nr:hypothetical protein [Shewanella sp. VB17]NRD74735.1 hypothetical protein [Shewanella sp. VB17]